MEKIKALFLAANPADTNYLKLDEEIRAVTEKIRAAEYRDAIELVSAWAVRADDLLQTFNAYKPHIVHFSGHGSPIGEILIVDNHGQAKSISTDALKALFTTLKDNIRVVILNACYSHLQAEAITEVIDFAIGMDADIGDNAAILFAASFYRGIGFGRSIQEAFEQGQVALLLQGIPEEKTPKLVAKSGIDPSQIFLSDTVKDGDSLGDNVDDNNEQEIISKILFLENENAELRAKLSFEEQMEATDTHTLPSDIIDDISKVFVTRDNAVMNNNRKQFLETQLNEQEIY